MGEIVDILTQAGEIKAQLASLTEERDRLASLLRDTQRKLRDAERVLNQLKGAREDKAVLSQQDLKWLQARGATLRWINHLDRPCRVHVRARGKRLAISESLRDALAQARQKIPL